MRVLRWPWMVLVGSMGAGPTFAATDYLTPAGCPDEPAFWSAVRARSLSIESSTVALDVTVVITATAADQLQGSVAVHGEAPRRLSAHDCHDLTNALALVTALLIDAEPRRTEAEQAAPAPLAVEEPRVRPALEPGAEPPHL